MGVMTCMPTMAESLGESAYITRMALKMDYSHPPRSRRDSVSWSPPSLLSLSFIRILSDMATLAPPPARHRASSTNVRPPLTIQSLGRRRSNSLLDIPSTPGHTPGHTPPRTPPPTDLPITPQSIVIPPLHLPVPRSGFSSMVSRWWQAIHLSSDHSYPSTPSSPRLSRASTDDSSILPIAESPIRSSFSENFPEKPLPPKSRPWTWEGSPSVCDRCQHFPLLLFPHLFHYQGTYTSPLRTDAFPRFHCIGCVWHVDTSNHDGMAEDTG